MRKNLNSILLLVAILLLAYIAFLKARPQRFATTPNFRILLDTTTGRLCDGRTPPKQAIKDARRNIKRLEALLPPAPGFVLETAIPPPAIHFVPYEKTALDKAWDHLKSLLYHRFPYCSEL